MSPSLKTTPSSESLSPSVDGPQEADDHPQRCLSPKGGTNTDTRGTVPPHASNCERITDDADSFSSQRIAANAQPLLFEGQIFQILADMKKQMKKQRAQSDHEREQVALDHKNVVR